MRDGRRWCLLFVLLLGPFVGTQAQDCYSSDQTRTVLTADDVERSGAIRLTDLFRLMPDWHTVSTDYYLWLAGPGIYSLPEWDGMMLMVDGQPLHATVLGISYLNAYPLDVGLIDSIEVFEGPVLCEGVFAPSGLIHIRTRLEKGPVYLGATGAVMNETGDPGPYRYTPLETENIDRSGPLITGFGGVAGPFWHGRAVGKSDEHHVTGMRLRPRVRRLYEMGRPPRHFLDGGHVDVRFDRPFYLSFSADQSHFEHFRFMPTFGSEIPFSTDWSRGGIRGAGKLFRNTSFFFSAEYTHYQLYENPVTPELPMDWRNERFSMHGGIALHTSRLRVAGGFSSYKGRMRGEVRLLDPDVQGSTFFLTTDATVTDQITARFAGRFAREADGPYGSLIAGLDYRPFRGHTARVTFSDVHMPLHQATPLFYWAERGFTLKSLPDFLPEVRLSRHTARRTSFSGGWHWAPWSIGTISAHGIVGWFNDFPIADYHLEFVQDSTEFGHEIAYFDVESRLNPETDGRISRVSVEATITPIRDLKATLYYAGTVVHAGHEAFRRSWQIVPRHRGYASITYSPMQRASVHARISFESWSYWPQYAAVEAPSDGRYPARLPVLALVDVAVTKRFWLDHVKVSALISNALNRPYQRHPAGAVESLAILARVQIQI